MRLIDADKIEVNENAIFTGAAIKKFIDDIPAAYDVGKVVERLMCESINCHIMTDRAIEIVKSGGVSDD